MNGYLEISDRQLTSYRQVQHTAQQVTDPQIYPRETLEEAVSSGDIGEAPLNARRRNALPSMAFALPGRRYPVDTPERARAALSRIQQYGSPEEIRKVKSVVRRRYPDMAVTEA